MWPYQLQYSKMWSLQPFKGATVRKNKKMWARSVQTICAHLTHEVDLMAGIDFIQSNSVVKAGIQSLSLL